VTALIRWFPDRRGLAAGMAVCGFGFAALIAAPTANALMARFGVPRTFLAMGLGYGVILLIASVGLRMPEASGIAANAAAPGVDSDLTVAQALGTTRFWLLWAMFFLNICAGIMLIALASPMAQETHHLTAPKAAMLVGLMGIANGCGRLLWPGASDYLGRSGTFILMFLLQIAVFAALPAAPSAPWFGAGVLAILSCYGAGFAIGPAFLADMFGTRHTGAIYGVLLTAWGAAAVAGPQLGAVLRQATGSYRGALHIITMGLAVALALSVMLRLLLAHGRKASEKKHGSATTAPARGTH
jgi:OFA family oxalate/formate antiporter-like MFS transporter